jgi:hypothetical protein
LNATAQKLFSPLAVPANNWILRSAIGFEANNYQQNRHIAVLTALVLKRVWYSSELCGNKTKW